MDTSTNWYILPKTCGKVAFDISLQTCCCQCWCYVQVTDEDILHSKVKWGQIDFPVAVNNSRSTWHQHVDLPSITCWISSSVNSGKIHSWQEGGITNRWHLWLLPTLTLKKYVPSVKLMVETSFISPGIILRDNVISICEWTRYWEQVWHLNVNLDFVWVE